jgi:hypothetical protein
MTHNERIKMWLNGLRSGKYKHAIGKLRTKDGMCCLGVYLDLIAPDSWHEHCGDFINSNNDSSPQMLSDFHKCELSGNSFPKDFGRLAEINDQSTDYNNAIAWIEENLLEEENDHIK